MVSNLQVFSERISIRTGITRYQSVSMLHWSFWVPWTLALPLFLSVKFCLTYSLKWGWLLRRISIYECHLREDISPGGPISRTDTWTQVPDLIFEAVWNSKQSTLVTKRLVSGSSFLRVHMSLGNLKKKKKKIFVCLDALICKTKHPNQINYELAFISVILHPRIEVHWYEPVTSYFP